MAIVVLAHTTRGSFDSCQIQGLKAEGLEDLDHRIGQHVTAQLVKIAKTTREYEH
jgi:hypothetical protein